jgi:IS30 family transposase
MAGHLNLEEREVIAHMHRAGSEQTQIADRLGRHKSTISRELRRNRSRNGYWAAAAQRKAERRRSERPWKAKMDRPEVRRYVTERLR